MNSIIFRSGAAVLLPVMLILSVVVLLRGHNEPGGGFVGGLVAASAFSLYALAFRGADARRLLRIDPRVLIGVGLLVALLSGIPAMLTGAPFLEGRWTSISVIGFPEPLKLGTPLLFDIGVYLLVAGGTFLMVVTLEEARYDRPAGR